MPSPADRHLLFGLLALQTGLIDQGQLVSAFYAWTRAKARPLADILVEQGAIDGARRSLLEGLAAEHLRAHGDDLERSLAAVPVGTAVRDGLQAVVDPDVSQTIKHLTPGSALTEHAADRTTTYAAGAATADGGRFRVLRPHARGGLGAVFVALDAELNREVALKQILDNHADDPVSRQRFLIEAEITGGLEHPGIVPVYGLGTYEDGRPYYAMRFVRGDSLKEAIEAFHQDEALKADPGRRSLELRKLLRRFLDVCNAIDYAHGRGVLHRDIKPGNIIVGKHGETLVVDWGLAKAQGHADADRLDGERTLRPHSASGTAETLPGLALGTPAYMSPEQARGDLESLGPASDIYSLGATLYCLLTGMPPFEGDLADILRNVQNGRFAPPRKVDSTIDEALEAVCLKAMALKPPDRYPSAHALAEDIERWTADEPVSAWVEPVRRRLARWQTRHPALVYGGVAVLLVTAVGVSAAALAIARARDATEAARLVAVKKTGEADQAFREATEATYYFMNRLADQRLAREPGLIALRKELTDEAIVRFEKFLGYRPDDATLLQQAARAHRDAALVRSLLGDYRGARTATLHGLELLEKVPGIKSSPMLRYTLVDARIDAARIFADFCHDAEAAEQLALAEALIEPILSGKEPLGPQERALIPSAFLPLSARIALKQADSDRRRGELRTARERYVRAIREFSETVREQPNVWFWQHLYLAQAHRGLGMVAQEEGKEDEAGREIDEAVRICREQVAAKPDEPDPIYILGCTLSVDAGRKRPDPARAEAVERQFAEALKALDDAVAHNPARLETSLDRAEIVFRRGAYRAAVGRDEPASADLEAARKSLRDLRDSAYRENFALPGLIGRVELELGRLRLKQGKRSEGIDLLKSAAVNLDTAARERPGIVVDSKAREEARAALREAAP